MKTPPAMELQKEIILSVPRLKLQSLVDFLATMQTGIKAQIAITMYTIKAVTTSSTWLSMLTATMLGCVWWTDATVYSFRIFRLVIFSVRTGQMPLTLLTVPSRYYKTQNYLRQGHLLRLERNINSSSVNTLCRSICIYFCCALYLLLLFSYFMLEGTYDRFYNHATIINSPTLKVYTGWIYSFLAEVMQYFTKK